MVSGCAPSIAYDEAEIRAYADPATEVILQGLSENDLDKYIQNGNEAFKAAVTQEMLDELSPRLNEQLGSYLSIDFKKITVKGEYIIVHYKANYDRGEVGVRMVFDENHLVAGQWFE